MEERREIEERKKGFSIRYQCWWPREEGRDWMWAVSVEDAGYGIECYKQDALAKVQG